MPFAGKWQLSIGPALKYTSNEQDRDELINTVNPYGSGDYGALAVHGILSWDGRDSAVLPRRGAFAAVRGTYFPEAWDVESAFGQVNGNVNAYLPLGGRVTLALRGGGKKVFGTYPYMEAAALGQGGLGAGALEEPENTLRGYRARRFTGDSSAYGNADLRLRISSMNIVVPGVWGLTAFGDVGRVWLEGESSDKWHTGVGGGLWFSWLTNRLSASVGVSHSKEDDALLLHGRPPLLIAEAPLGTQLAAHLETRSKGGMPCKPWVRAARLAVSRSTGSTTRTPCTGTCRRRPFTKKPSSAGRDASPTSARWSCARASTPGAPPTTSSWCARPRARRRSGGAR